MVVPTKFSRSSSGESTGVPTSVNNILVQSDDNRGRELTRTKDRHESNQLTEVCEQMATTPLQSDSQGVAAWIDRSAAEMDPYQYGRELR
jgi:hypothetical protein